MRRIHLFDLLQKAFLMFDCIKAEQVQITSVPDYSKEFWTFFRKKQAKFLPANLHVSYISADGKNPHL
jgi:hypothetical protein